MPLTDQELEEIEEKHREGTKLPYPGDQVEWWRRDPGGKSQRVTAKVLEVIPPAWLVVKRDDTGEERTIDPKRVRVIALGKTP